MDCLSLSVVVRQNITETSMKDAGATGGQSRRMFASRRTATASFDAEQLHGCIVKKRMKHPCRVASAPDAGDDDVRQATKFRQALSAGLVADDALKVADDH